MRLGRAKEEGAEASPFEVGPLLEFRAARGREVGEEVAAVQCDDRSVVTGFGGGQEVVAISGERRSERDRVLLGGEERLPDLLLDVPERLAKGVLSLLRFHVGPEEVEELLAARGVSGGGGDEGNEGERFAEVEERFGGVTVEGAAEGGVAEGAEVEGAGAGGRCDRLLIEGSVFGRCRLGPGVGHRASEARGRASSGIAGKASWIIGRWRAGRKSCAWLCVR